MATQAAGTQAIHDLVREGRVTPEDGAELLAIRSRIDESRDRIALRSSPVAQLIVFLGVFVLAFLGIKRQG